MNLQKMAKSNKVVWTEGNNLFVVRKDTTPNDKISEGKVKIVQTYTFSIDQWTLANTQKGFGMKQFFALDGSNCLDCPFSLGSGDGGCYTHKYEQYCGFLKMLRSIKAELLTEFSQEKESAILEMCNRTYVRFGSYGEPSLLNYNLVDSMAVLSSGWTGYTHQWEKIWAKPYGRFFMASTHNQEQSVIARENEWRSFIATKVGTENATSCPASKEMGYKSNCAKCGLCSGTNGKGTKDVKILEH